MRRMMLWMLTLLIGLTPVVIFTQPAKPQTKPAPAKATPIAKAEHQVGGVEVALMEVKRTGTDSVTIKFRYTNKTIEKKNLAHGGQGLDAWRFAWDAYFVDAATNKKYVPLKDENGYPVAANHQEFGTGITLKARQVVNTWAKFPAPPPEVEVVTVYLPGAPPFEDVKVTK